MIDAGVPGIIATQWLGAVAPAGTPQAIKFDPPEAENQLNIMLCGALQPFTLEPGAERKIVTGYLFTGETHKGSSLAVTYELRLR
jgi:hypothetical protein